MKCISCLFTLTSCFSFFNSVVFYCFHFCFQKLIFIGIQLICNIMLLSSVQQSESAIHTHISPPFWISFPFGSPQSVEFPLLDSMFLLLIYFIHSINRVHVSVPNLLIPPSRPHLVSIHLFSTSVFISVLQISSSVPFCQIPHICVNI